jgi:hypothetical protein
VALTGVDDGRILAELDPESYRRHLIHGEDRIWSETNCYTDVWIELLHALGAEPLALCAFCLSADFEGTQWSFFKPPLEDIRELYGIEVTEMNVWRPILDHLEEEIALGRLLTVEVDSWFLPDTAGVSYRTEHVKTTIVPALVDRDRRILRYFHGAGFHELVRADFDGLFAAPLLPPYVELVRLENLSTDAAFSTVLSLARKHLSRRPATNPIHRLALRLSELAPWLAAQTDPEMFHKFAFGTLRQCGANAELAASHVEWLTRSASLPTGDTVARFLQVAEGAKTLQFALARAARGRTVDLVAAIDPLADAWDAALGQLDEALAATTQFLSAAE